MSCGLIVLLLILPFGLAALAHRRPAVAGGAVQPGQPRLAGPAADLFSLFGLLLVTAISVDYAILMREQIGGPR
jgi:predicted exporter